MFFFSYKFFLNLIMGDWGWGRFNLSFKWLVFSYFLLLFERDLLVKRILTRIISNKKFPEPPPDPPDLSPPKPKCKNLKKYLKKFFKYLF